MEDNDDSLAIKIYGPRTDEKRTFEALDFTLPLTPSTREGD